MISPRTHEQAERGATYCGIAVPEVLADFRLACMARELDDRQLILHKQGRTYFHIAGAGHEALLTAFARSLRPGYDWFFPYYRDLPLVLALGVSPYEVLLQAVGSAEDPASGGRQMPSHWASRPLHIVSQSSPTGSQCIPAVGCAETTRFAAGRSLAGVEHHDDEVTYVSIGEGATSEGEFWESLNTASKMRLPIVYLVADNGYAISVRSEEQAPAPIGDLISGFPHFEVARIDGGDYFAARQAAERAVKRARAGDGPSLVQAAVTRPYSHSSSDNQLRYRSADELAKEAAIDPLARMEHELMAAGLISADDVAKMKAEARELVLAAAAKALDAARPNPETVLTHLVSLAPFPEPEPPSDEGSPVHFSESIRRVLHEAMASDERVRVFGEDVADADPAILAELDGLGGVFGTTLGLQRSFGKDRCFNTPLAEANIIGRAVGQAVRGLRPVPEIQFVDYIWPAMQQIRSEAATMRWRSNGTFSAPIVVRCAIGGYLAGGSIWHSQCGESIFAHTPGLLVAFPSRARDAVGLFRAAMSYEDPVLFLEHKHLFRQRYAMDPYPEANYVLPFGKGTIVRPGEDLSIVTWGATVRRSLLAAEELAKEGIEAEVVDLRTLAPWDRELVADTVARTSRLLVVHEDVLTGGFGGEVAAFVAEHCFGDLDAPVRRIGALDTWVAYEPTLERAILPQVDQITDAARSLAEY